MIDDAMSFESLLEAMEGIVFVTTPGGSITAVGARNWNAFAQSNGAAQMSASTVIGRTLFDFISGSDVKEQLGKIMTRSTADSALSVVVPFRCDSPDTRRELRQSIRPIFSQDSCVGLLFQSIELNMQRRPPIDLFDFKKNKQQCAQDASLPIVVMCSWCQRIRYPPIAAKDWIEAEEYYSAGGKSGIRLTHSICDRCSEMVSTP